MIGDIKIQEGWLKVQKVFKDEYVKNEDIGCAAGMRTCVMLKTSIDENLR